MKTKVKLLPGEWNLVSYWVTISDLDEYNDKYMKIRFNSDDNLLLKQELETRNILIIIRSVFCDSNKFYPQV